MKKPDFDELESCVENTRVAYEDNPEWRKEIEKDINKCLEMLQNW